MRDEQQRFDEVLDALERKRQRFDEDLKRLKVAVAYLRPLLPPDARDAGVGSVGDDDGSPSQGSRREQPGMTAFAGILMVRLRAVAPQQPSYRALRVDRYSRRKRTRTLAHIDSANPQDVAHPRPSPENREGHRPLRKKSQSITPTRVTTTRKAATKSPISCTAPRYHRKDPAALGGDIPAEREGFEPSRALD